MHLADGIVSEPTLVVGLSLAGAGAVGAAIERSRGTDARALAWMGTLSAFVLAAQAINVPLAFGVSTHAIGAGLLTLTLGPARSIVAMTAVLTVQALLLADGGLTALGINALNLAVLPALAVHGCRRLLGESRSGLMAAALLGTTVGNVAGAAGLAAVLVFAAGLPAGWTFAWLVGAQAASGLIEGVLTAIAVGQLVDRAPALTRWAPGPRALGDAEAPKPRRAVGALVWAAVATGLLIAALPLSSDDPDPLERVVEQSSSQ